MSDDPSSNRMTYLQHEHAAVMELREHILHCKHGDGSSHIERLDEADLMEDALYSDGSQVKFLPNNILKIKWESPCSWSGCVWHLYYCKLASNIVFKEIKEVL